MTNRGGTMDIFVGNFIQHESERVILKEVERLLVADGLHAVVFANFSVAAHQTDLFIAVDGLALVIEAKSGNRPVRGGENGPWEILLANRNWKEIRNPYEQALDAALAIKNAIRSFSTNGPRFINSAVVYTNDIPEGSNIYPGNFKVSIIGQSDLGGLLRKQCARGWSAEQWVDFAKHLKLTHVASVSAACDPGIVEAVHRLQHYATMFNQMYSDSENLIPFSCRTSEETILSTDVAHLMLEKNDNVLFQGPTGCGKSMLAASIGTAFNRKGDVVVYLQAKNFGSKVHNLIDREAQLLGAPSGNTLLKDAQMLNRSLHFVIDGYNECTHDRREDLTRAIAGLVYSYEARVVVTSQVPLAKSNLLRLHKFEVLPPDMEIKRAIADGASNSTIRSNHLEILLTSVSTGLEARLVGEVGAVIRQGSSRFALFDEFARKRFGEHALVCIGVLSQVAAWLSDRLTFSMSVRDFNRLTDHENLSTEHSRLLLQSGLLASRGDRISFSHEMFLNAFAAESVIRTAGDRPESVLQALTVPLNSARKDLIIGAIDDDRMLERLLSDLDDPSSIRSCLLGHCGHRAKNWADERCQQLWIRLAEEAGNVRFQYGMGGWKEGIVFNKDGLTQWTRADYAFFDVLPGLIMKGRFVENAFQVIKTFDNRMEQESNRLLNGSESHESQVRTAMFAISYMFPRLSESAPGISAICASLHNGTAAVVDGTFIQPDYAPIKSIMENLVKLELSNGQLCLYLRLCCYGGIPASFIANCIKKNWDTAPYHLCLELLESANFHAVAKDRTEKVRLIKTVKSLLGRRDLYVPDWRILETLQFLGELDDSTIQHQAVVVENIRHCLARPTERDSQDMAWTIYFAQFDHPYSQAYFKTVNDLVNDNRKKFLEMAAIGAPEESLFLLPLICDLASFGDQGVGEKIARWTALPRADNIVMPKNAIETYMVAHIALARLGCPLPKHRIQDSDSAKHSLRACGAILYWSNRIDLSEIEILSNCDSGLLSLESEGRCSALDVICECEHAQLELPSDFPGDQAITHSIVRKFPDRVATISRDALRNSRNLVGYFNKWSKCNLNRNLSFAINVLKHYGSGEDKPLLRKYATNQEFGEDALDALKVLEERLEMQFENTA